MNGRLRVFGIVLRRNLALFVTFLALTSVILFVVLSNSRVYASDTVANVEYSVGTYYDGEFVVNSQNSYFLGGEDSQLNNIAEQCQELGCVPSICYVYRIQNLTDYTIGGFVDYNQNNSVNFTTFYSINDGEQREFNSFIFDIPARGERVITIFVNVEDVTLDAYLDGTLNVGVSALGGDLNG